MRVHVKLFLAGILLWMSGLPLLAQTTIRLVDSKTKEPVSFAHVCFESLDREVLQNRIADVDGAAEFSGNRAFQVAVTSMGYVTLIDTLQPGGVHTLYLEPTWFEMDEVVVTAQFSPRRADQSIYNVKVIDNRKIREKGATNLSELLNNELGVRISNDAALGSSMSIQGLSGEHVKILVDGVPVIGRMDGNIDLSQINMHNVDHIEMVEGPMSVIYGSNALAGAVNIITKENTRSKLSVWQNSYLESVEVYNFDLGVSGNFSRHSLSLTGARNFFGGFSEADTSRSKQWKPKLQYSLDGYYIYRTDRLKIKVDLKFFDETILNKGPLLKPYFEHAFNTYYYTKRWSQQAQANYDFGKGKKIEAIFANSSYSRVTQSYYMDLTNLEAASSSSDTTRFGSYLFRSTFTDERPSGTLSYQAGLDINLENGEGIRIHDNSQSIGDYAAFVSLRYEPSSFFSFQPGLRYGYNTKYRSPLVPSLNIRWHPSSGKNVLRASYARGFRAPSLKELYLFFVDINHNIRGNLDLKAEYSHNLNLTWDYTLDRRYNQYGLQAGLFYNSIHNRIDLLLDSITLSAPIYSYINVSGYRTAGGKLNLKYKMHPRFTIELGIFEVGRQYIQEGGVNKSDFLLSTDVSSNVSYNWLSRRLRFLISYKYVGRHPELTPNQDGEFDVGFIENYQMLDISATKSFRQDRVILGIGAKNLFDYTNVKFSGLTAGTHSSGEGVLVGRGRTYFISLRFFLSKY